MELLNYMGQMLVHEVIMTVNHCLVHVANKILWNLIQSKNRKRWRPLISKVSLTPRIIPEIKVSFCVHAYANEFFTLQIFC